MGWGGRAGRERTKGKEGNLGPWSIRKVGAYGSRSTGTRWRVVSVFVRWLASCYRLQWQAGVSAVGVSGVERAWRSWRPALIPFCFVAHLCGQESVCKSCQDALFY